MTTVICRNRHPLPFRYDDGGRKASGRQGKARDCVARAIAIATGKPYGEVYDALAAGNSGQRRSRRDKGTRRRSASHGIYTTRKWFRAYMHALGFAWIPTMGIGTGCTTHLAVGEVPNDCIASCSRHLVAVVDGTVRDTSDPTRNGTRCVYGFWERPRVAERAAHD